MRSPCILAITTALLLARMAHGACVGPAALEAKVRLQPSAKGFADLGIWFDHRRRYDCAVQSYRSALKLSPASPRILELLGSSLDMSGDLDGSVKALQQAIQLSPNTLAPHLKLAAALEEIRDTGKAKIEWQAALKIDPQSKAALDGLSQHLIAEGDYGGAISLLRAARLDEKLTLDLAQAYGKASMLDEAENSLAAALTQAPASFPLTNALATVRVNQGLPQKALKLAEEFAKKNPGNSDAQTLHLRLFLLNNNTRDAMPLAHRLLAAHPRDAYFLYVSGTLERQNGEYETARNHLQQAVAIQPDFYYSHYQLGLVLATFNDLHGARAHLEKAISLGVPDPEVHVELATVLKKLGETNAAENQLRLYRETAQIQSSHTVAQGKAVLAEKELNSGKPEKAAALYREALQATPEDALLNYKLSLALDKVGDSAGERAALEKAVHADPDMAIAHNQLGYLASRSGDAASAEDHFRQAVRAAPTYTQAWINLAATLGIEGKFPEAQNAVNHALKLDPANAEASQLLEELSSSQQQH